MISEKLNHRLDNVLARIAQIIFGKNVHPHFLTFMGLFINVGAAVCLGMGYWVIGGCLIILAGFFDISDGAVARVSNKETSFGGFLDSVVDRYSDIVLLIGIIWYYAKGGESGYIFLACIVLMGCILIPYTRAKAEVFINRCNIGLMERAERTIFLAMGSIFNVMNFVLWILAILTHITVIQRIYYAWKEMQKPEEPTANHYLELTGNPNKKRNGVYKES
ncbi:MAG: CDP-alcohol phosphatidyltransferase family protein [Deltaproteobacteria bacterium]|nr:CDP-alcohol phosphatidyltransferase family protein [Deltaproteobacteria bacterium]